MSALKPGTLCVIVGGCPENIGMVVEVVKHIGVYGDREEAYRFLSASGVQGRLGAAIATRY